MKKLNKKGFTLIEILVVVAIIGILAGVVLISLRGTGPQARDTRRASELKSVQNGLQLYYNKMGEYPPAGNWEALETELVGAEIGITKIAFDPTDGQDYEYYTNTNQNNYILKATLEVKGSTLTGDDIDNSDLPTGTDAITADCGDGEDDEDEYCVSL